MENKKISIEEIDARLAGVPLTATIGDLLLNVFKALEIMKAVSDGKIHEARDLAHEICGDNLALIESQMDKMMPQKVIEKERKTVN